MKSNHLILAIVGAFIVAGIGFYGGTIYAKTLPRTSGANGERNGQFAVQFAGRAGGAQGAGNARGGMMGGFASGKIVSADDKGITIEMMGGPDGASGGSKIIFTSDSTKVYKMTEGSKTDLTKDTSVTVTGATNQDGSITAQSIQIRPEGMTMPMIGGFGGGQDRTVQGGGRGPGGNGGAPGTAPAQQ